MHLGENPTNTHNASYNKYVHTSINNRFFRIFQNGNSNRPSGCDKELLINFYCIVLDWILIFQEGENSANIFKVIAWGS